MTESYAHSRTLRYAYVDGGWNSTADAVASLADALTYNYPNTWCQGGQIQGSHGSLSTLRLAAEAAGKHKVRFLTMLREPVARTVSEWIDAYTCARDQRACGTLLLGDTWRRYVGMWEYKCGGYQIDGNISLVSFLNSSATKIAWSNRQTRMLTAPGVRLEGAVTAATRARAVAVMRSMDFVGLVGRFEDSMLLLSYIFRASLPHFTSFASDRANAQKIKYEPTPAERTFLERANEHDTALYAAASARFDADWAAMLTDESFRARGMRFYSSDKVNYTLIPASDVPPPAPPAAEQESDPGADPESKTAEECQAWAASRVADCG